MGHATLEQLCYQMWKSARRGAARQEYQTTSAPAKDEPDDKMSWKSFLLRVAALLAATAAFKTIRDTVRDRNRNIIRETMRKYFETNRESHLKRLNPWKDLPPYEKQPLRTIPAPQQDPAPLPGESLPDYMKRVPGTVA